MRCASGRVGSLLPSAVLVCTFLGCPAAARAQGNAFSVPLGGRSALMGNTGTALAVDGAAPFLNPASVVRLDAHGFAFSVNFYSFSVTRFSGWHQPGPVDASKFGTLALGDTGITASGFNAVPSTLCVFLTLAAGDASTEVAADEIRQGRQKLSLCFGSLESQSLSFTALPFTGATSLGQTIQSQSVVQSWNRLYAGPSYSVALSKRLALGVSLHAVATSESFILQSTAITSSSANGGVQSAFGSGGSGSSLDLAARLGAIYRLGHFTTGLSVGLPALHLNGSYSGSFQSEYGSGAAGTATLSSGSGEFSAAPPMRIGLGLGGEWPGITVEADASVNIPAPSGFSANVAGNTSTLGAGTLTASTFQTNVGVTEHTVVSAGVGAEYYLKPRLSLLGGTSLNLTALPPLSPVLAVGNIVQARNSFFTVAGGVGTRLDGTDLLLGLQFNYGWGQSLAANPYVTPNQWAVVDTTSYTALVIFAGSLNLKTVEHAVEKVEHVLTGTPIPPPAAAPVAGPAISPAAPTAPARPLAAPPAPAAAPHPLVAPLAPSVPPASPPPASAPAPPASHPAPAPPPAASATEPPTTSLRQAP